jgi:hypothetical protein
VQCGKRFGFVVNVTLGRPRFCSRTCQHTARHAGGKYGVTEEKFRELFNAGKSYREIASVFGIKNNSVIGYYIKKFKLWRPEPLRDNLRLDGEYYLAKVVRMYNSGMSANAIAKAFKQGHSHGYIRTLLIRAGVWRGRNRHA